MILRRVKGLSIGSKSCAKWHDQSSSVNVQVNILERQTSEYDYGSGTDHVLDGSLTE